MDPIIDPTTGKPTKPTTPKPPTVEVPAEEWGAIKARLDSFERGFNNNPQPAALQPSAPQRPTLESQLSEIDAQIATLDDQIDTAVSEGKGVSKVLRERDALNQKRTRLQIKYEDLDPAFNAGIQTIDQISAELSRGKMKYYDIVKDDVEKTLRDLPAAQRMNPQVREAAYKFAVGENITKIMEAQKEELLRAETAAAAPPPPTNNGRNTQYKDGEVPNPEDVLSKDSIAAMRSIGKDPDTYYKNLGYTGWKDFWEKRGKEYFANA